jgi:hypothetical protein
MREDTGEEGLQEMVLWRYSAWCQVRMEDLQVLEMCLKSGGVYVCAEEEGGMPDCPELKSELLRGPFHSLR